MPLDLNFIDRGYVLQLWVFKFLMRLNPKYKSLCSQLIHLEETLTYKEALTIVQTKETYLHLIHSKSASTMDLQYIGSSRPMSIHEGSSNVTYRVVTQSLMTPSILTSVPPSKRDSFLFYNYCKKYDHTKQICQKQHKNTCQSSLVTTSTDGLPSISRTTTTSPHMPLHLLLGIPQQLIFDGSSSMGGQVRWEEIDQLCHLIQLNVVRSMSLAH